MANKKGGSGGNFFLLLIVAGLMYLALGPYQDDLKRFYFEVKERAQREVFSVAPSIERMVETEREGRPAIPKDLGSVSKQNKFDRLTQEDRKKLDDLLESKK
jgi:hypothetical protein